MKKPRIVEVEWIDASSKGGWGSVEWYLKNSQPSLCRSTGYLLRKDAKAVTLVQSLGDHKDGTDAIAIPRSCVKRIRYLK